MPNTRRVDGATWTMVRVSTITHARLRTLAGRLLAVEQQAAELGDDEYPARGWSMDAVVMHAAMHLEREVDRQEKRLSRRMKRRAAATKVENQDGAA